MVSPLPKSQVKVVLGELKEELLIKRMRMGTQPALVPVGGPTMPATGFLSFDTTPRMVSVQLPFVPMINTVNCPSELYLW